MKKFSRARILVLVTVFLVLLTGLLAGWRYLQISRAAEELPVNTRMGGDFVLPSTQGAPLDTRQLRGKVVLLNFGFATCPDICPMVLARLRQVMTELGADAARTQVVFVSFDPARDTVGVLKEYVSHFHPDIIGATGTEAEIAAVTRQYGVVYMKEDTGSAAGYGFAHSDYIYLLDMQGRVRKLYDSRTPTTDISRDVKTLLVADRWQ